MFGVIGMLLPAQSFGQTGDQVSESAILSMKERAKVIDDVLRPLADLSAGLTDTCIDDASCDAASCGDASGVG